MTSPDDIPTAKISRTVEAAPAVVLLERRVDDLEERVDDHSDWLRSIDSRLSRGDVHFAEIRKDLERIADEVRAVRAILTWVGSAIGGGILAAGGGALLWVLRQGGVG